jgi:hypothetical protein
MMRQAYIPRRSSCDLDAFGHGLGYFRRGEHGEELLILPPIHIACRQDDNCCPRSTRFSA